jgi:acyl carrier protein
MMLPRVPNEATSWRELTRVDLHSYLFGVVRAHSERHTPQLRSDFSMEDVGNAPHGVIDRKALEQKILSFLQSEIQDKTIVLTMDTPLEKVVIDSIDIIGVVFKIEEEFNISIEFSPDRGFTRVGDLINALINLIPPDR